MSFFSPLGVVLTNAGSGVAAAATVALSGLAFLSPLDEEAPGAFSAAACGEGYQVDVSTMIHLSFLVTQ
jgi:hypothetical protein